MAKATHLLILVSVLSLVGCTFRTVHHHVHQHPGEDGQCTSSEEASAASVLYADNLPPEPTVETRPAPPYPDWVWIDGFWHWEGSQ